MAIIITAPDGREVEFPDGTPNAVIEKVMAKESSPPKVTGGGLVGSVIRGMAPMAAGTAIGAAAGAPLAGVGAIPGAALGALATTAEEIGGNLYNVAAPYVGLPRFTTFGERINQGLDVLKVPRPDTQLERIIEVGAGGASGASGLARALSQLSPKMASPVAKEVFKIMGQQPVRQTAAGGIGGLAAQTGIEAGLPPVVAGLTGIAAGGVPFMVRGGGSLPQTKRAVQGGYTIPPAMASENPSMMARLLSKVGGEELIERAATIKNQAATNNLVKKELGIKDDIISVKALNDIRAKEGSVYQDVKNVPGTAVDNTFNSDVAAIKATINALSKNFKAIVKNDEVDKLVKAITPRLGSKAYDSTSAVELTKVLRQKSAKNIMSDKPELNELGKAQRAASEAIENMLARRIMNAPPTAGVPKDLAIRWNEARTKISQSHLVEEALNPATGNVDAKRLGRVIDKGDAKLTGGLQTAGEAALAFPRVTGSPEKMPAYRLGDLTSMVARAAPGAAVGYGTGSPELGMAITAAQTVAAPAARGLSLSKRYQQALGAATPKSKQDIARALAAALSTRPNYEDFMQ